MSSVKREMYYGRLDTLIFRSIFWRDYVLPRVSLGQRRDTRFLLSLQPAIFIMPFFCSTRNMRLTMLNPVCHCLVLFVWWAIIQFLAIWSSGVGSPIVEIIVYTVFAVTSTFWVIYLKVENVKLILGDEDVWTFGQALPVFLFLLVMFRTLDDVQGKSDVPHIRLNELLLTVGQISLILE